jgi:hypothetical protein
MLSVAIGLVIFVNQVMARDKAKVISGSSEMIVDGKILKEKANTIQSNVITGDGQTKTVNVEDGKEVTLKGDNNVITLKGKTGTLRIIGKGNKVNAEGLDGVIIAGDDNTVSYQTSRGPGGKPAERIVGKNNTVG